MLMLHKKILAKGQLYHVLFFTSLLVLQQYCQGCFINMGMFTSYRMRCHELFLLYLKCFLIKLFGFLLPGCMSFLYFFYLTIFSNYSLHSILFCISSWYTVKQLDSNILHSVPPNIYVFSLIQQFVFLFCWWLLLLCQKLFQFDTVLLVYGLAASTFCVRFRISSPRPMPRCLPLYFLLGVQWFQVLPLSPESIIS